MTKQQFQDVIGLTHVLKCESIIYTVLLKITYISESLNQHLI